MYSLRKLFKHSHMKTQRMWLTGLLIFFLNYSYLTHAFNFETADIDAEAEWESMDSFGSSDDYEGVGFVPRSKIGATSTEPLPPLNLPESVRMSASQLRKDYFKPEEGTRPVPPLVQSILLPVGRQPARKPAASGTSAPKMLEVLCHLDRIYVRVMKSLFTNPNAYKNLKLGTCAVNKATSTHYYFLYYLKGCDLKRGEDANRVTYTNTLYFRPAVTVPIVRELPFTVPIRCTYTKFHRAYQIGFLPKVASNFYRSLQNQVGASLSAVDASWKLLANNQSFVIGKPMCFEAQGPRSNKLQRLYLNTCFVSSSANAQQAEKYSVVENYGCLVDSKTSAVSKFYASASNLTVRFCIAAFMFKTMVSLPQTKKTMFMHCEFDVGPGTPTPSAKSCTYNAKTKKWTELSGVPKVCDCCESSCSVSPKAIAGKMTISSKSWDLKSEKETPVDSKPEFSLSSSDDFELFWESDDY